MVFGSLQIIIGSSRFRDRAYSFIIFIFILGDGDINNFSNLLFFKQKKLQKKHLLRNTQKIQVHDDSSILFFPSSLTLNLKQRH